MRKVPVIRFGNSPFISSPMSMTLGNIPFKPKLDSHDTLRDESPKFVPR